MKGPSFTEKENQYLMSYDEHQSQDHNPGVPTLRFLFTTGGQFFFFCVLKSSVLFIILPHFFLFQTMTIDNIVKEKSSPIIAKASSCEKTVLRYEFIAKWNNDISFFLLVPARRTYYRRKPTQWEAWKTYQVLVRWWKLLITATVLFKRLPSCRLTRKRSNHGRRLSELHKNHITVSCPAHGKRSREIWEGAGGGEAKVH